jgi:integrase
MTQMPSIFIGSPGNPHLQNASSNLKPNPTFREQGKIWLDGMANRKWNPVQPSALSHWMGVLKNWLYPVIGECRLSDFNNTSVRRLVDQMVEAGLCASTIRTYTLIVKAVVASLVDSNGKPVYARTWNSRFLGLPQFNPLQVNAPCFSHEIVSGLATWKSPTERMLFILAGATGARVGELLGLEIDRHISPDFSTLRIVRTLNNRVKSPCAEREIDLHSSVSRLLSAFVGGRASGFLFRSRTGKHLSASTVLRYHLHPALKELGFLNPQNKSAQAGFYAFRRFRKVHLFNCEGLPARIRNYWTGHRDDSVDEYYGGLEPDRALRKHWAERCGIGFDLYT